MRLRIELGIVITGIFILLYMIHTSNIADALSSADQSELELGLIPTFDSSKTNLTSLASSQTLTCAIDTFSARGILASTLLDPVELDNNVGAELLQEMIIQNLTIKPWIIGGNWSLTVVNGDISQFQANFVMTKADGTRFHTHTLNNFVLNAIIPIALDPQLGATFTGMFDIKEDGENKWLGTQTRITISRLNTISILFDQNYTENHFLGQPLYGIVQSLKVQNGTELVK